MTLLLDMDLPEGALLPPDAPVNATLPDSAIRFQAGAAQMPCEDGTITEWRASDGTQTARPARPNQGNAQLADHAGHPVLSLRARVNCGFALEGLELPQALCSAAVVFAAPPGATATLLTLNPQGAAEYLFLTVDDGALRLVFRNSGAALSVPLTGTGPFHLALIQAEGDRLALASGDATPRLLRADHALPAGACDAFIGCRSDRKGILKTLGDAQIRDVYLLPGTRLFGPGAEPHRQALLTHWQAPAGGRDAI